MGYTTRFVGKLEFTKELTASQIAALEAMLGEDPRKHPEWRAARETGYIDLELTSQYDGLQWSGAEKTYGMVDAVNVILRVMRETWPDFGLRGRFDAQGEEIGDVWALIADEGGARRIELKLAGQRVTCPHCDEEFVLNPEVVEV